MDAPGILARDSSSAEDADRHDRGARADNHLEATALEVRELPLIAAGTLREDEEALASANHVDPALKARQDEGTISPIDDQVPAQRESPAGHY